MYELWKNWEEVDVCQSLQPWRCVFCIYLTLRILLIVAPFSLYDSLLAVFRNSSNMFRKCCSWVGYFLHVSAEKTKDRTKLVTVVHWKLRKTAFILSFIFCGLQLLSVLYDYLLFSFDFFVQKYLKVRRGQCSYQIFYFLVFLEV